MRNETLVRHIDVLKVLAGVRRPMGCLKGTLRALLGILVDRQVGHRCTDHALLGNHRCLIIRLLEWRCLVQAIVVIHLHCLCSRVLMLRVEARCVVHQAEALRDDLPANATVLLVQFLISH